MMGRGKILAAVLSVRSRLYYLCFIHLRLQPWLTWLSQEDSRPRWDVSTPETCSISTRKAKNASRRGTSTSQPKATQKHS